MTPAARLEAARLVLERWLDDDVPVERALTHWARGARYAGSKDRRAVRDHVYDILRQRGVCADLGGGDDARALILGLTRLNHGSAALFTGDGYGPEPLTEDEAARFALPVEVKRQLDTPTWLREMLIRQHDDWPAMEEAFARRAPVYLRVNSARITPADVQVLLAEDGVDTVQTPCATALEVTTGATKLARTAAYANGYVEPQDLSAQMACAMINWPRGKILDFCAGGGGKALAIAAATGQGIDIHDADPRRMADAPARAKRAGCQLRQVTDPEGPYDVVLTDVPCSGSGTWRRDPEARWRLDATRLADLVALQAAILDRAAELSSRLVYMTCSLLEQENAMQIEAFLQRQPGWECVASQSFTPKTASDGFFVADLRFGRN